MAKPKVDPAVSILSRTSLGREILSIPAKVEAKKAEEAKPTTTSTPTTTTTTTSKPTTTSTSKPKTEAITSSLSRTSFGREILSIPAKAEAKKDIPPTPTKESKVQKRLTQVGKMTGMVGKVFDKVETIRKKPEYQTEIIRIREERAQATEAFFQSLSGRHVKVRYRDPTGKIKSVLTSDVRGTVTGIQTTQYGEILTIAGVTAGGSQGRVYYDVEETILSKPSQMEKLQTKYGRTGKVPESYKKQFYITTDAKAGVKPLKETINIPEEVISLGAEEEYIRLSYEMGIGLLTEKEATYQLNKALEGKITVDWMKEHGKFHYKDTEMSWAALKGKLGEAHYLRKVDGKIEVVYDPRKWQVQETKEAIRDWDVGFLAGRAVSYITSPETWENVWESNFGAVQSPTLKRDGEGVYIGTWETASEREKRFARNVAHGHLEYYTAWSKGDWGKIGMRAISTPVVSLPLAYVGGALLGLGSSAVGSYAATHTALTGSGASALATATQAAIGGGMATYVGYDVYKTFETKGPEAGRKKLFWTAAHLGFGYAGYQAGTTMSIRGATASEWGGHWGYQKTVKGLIKKSVKYDGQTTTKGGLVWDEYGVRPSPGGYKSISPEQGYAALRYEQLGFELGRRFGKTTTYGYMYERLYNIDAVTRNVQNLTNKDIRAFAHKQAKHLDGEIYGSTSKGLTAKDWDVMFPKGQYGRSLRTAELAEQRFMGGQKTFDIHPLQKVGQTVTYKGGKKLVSYNIEGYKFMQMVETAQRRTDSSTLLAHWGRSKDIPRSVQDWTDVYIAAGSPKESAWLIKDFGVAATQYAKAPLIMDTNLAQTIYFKSTPFESFTDWSNKFIKKYIPGKVEAEFKGIMGKTYVKPHTTTSMPPTPKGIPQPSPTTVTLTYYVQNIVPQKPSTIYTTPSIAFHPTSFVRLYVKSPAFQTKSSQWYPAGFKKSTMLPSTYKKSSSMPSISSSLISSVISSSYLSKSYSVSPYSVSASPSSSFSLSPSSISPSSSFSYSPSSPYSSISSYSSSYSYFSSTAMPKLFPFKKIKGRRRSTGWRGPKLKKKYKFKEFIFGEIKYESPFKGI